MAGAVSSRRTKRCSTQTCGYFVPLLVRYAANRTGTITFPLWYRMPKTTWSVEVSVESISATQLWVGRALSAFAVLFLIVDAMMKVLRTAPALEGTVKLGYPESLVVPIGLLALVGVVLYVIPRTSVLGVIYLTAYLGGAVASKSRVGNPLFSHVLFPTYVAAMLWGGLVLRNPRLLGTLFGPQ